MKRFFIIVFILGFFFQSIYYFNQNQTWLLIAMWAPTLSVLLLGKSERHIFHQLKIIKPMWIAVGIFLAIMPFLFNQFSIWFFELGTWNDQTFILSENQTSISRIKNAGLVFGSEAQSFSFFGLNLFISILLGGFITTLVGAIGEEIGWRGFAQPHLIKKFGLIKGLLFLGIIWAYWHIPANLGGTNGKENILVTSFIIFPVSVIFMTFVIGWLRIRSNAIWPCAFFHGVNNALSGIYLFKPRTEMIDQLVSLSSSIIIGSLFIFLLWKNFRTASTAQKND